MIKKSGNQMNSQKSIHLQFEPSNRYEGKKKRTELGQLIRILEYLESSGQTILSSISRYANMSHCIAAQNCEKLISTGLIQRTVFDTSKKYRLTSDGRIFLEYCRNFENTLERYKLSELLCHY